MPISLRRVSDEDSFRSATGAPRDTAALYFFKQLDPIYDTALAVANDFFERPHLYTNIGDRDAVQLLARLRSQSGCDELLPSMAQRQQAYAPIFGPPEPSPTSTSSGTI